MVSSTQKDDLSIMCFKFSNLQPMDYEIYTLNNAKMNNTRSPKKHYMLKNFALSKWLMLVNETSK